MTSWSSAASLPTSLQNFFDVIAAEYAEIVEANETVRIEVGHFFLMKSSSDGRIKSPGPWLGAERFMTDLALRLEFSATIENELKPTPLSTSRLEASRM